MHGDALKMQSDQELANISTEEEVKEYLKRYIDEERWEKVVKMYYTVPQAHTSIVDDEGFTALHLAIYFRKEDVVRELLNAIIITNTTVESSSTNPQRLRALEIQDEDGDTPLHLAASNGFAKICRLIIGENDERIYLLSSKNKNGKTPLFKTVFFGQKQAFAYLSSKITRYDVTSQLDFVLDNDGRSILHVAIQLEHFDLALVILHHYYFLCTRASKDGSKPLDTVAEKPSAFRSGSSLSCWSRILYRWIVVEPVDPEREMKSYLREMEQYRVDPAEMKNNHFPNFCSRLLSTAAASFGKPFRARCNQHDIENPPCNAQNKRILSSENSLIGFLGSIYATFKRYTYATFQHAYAYTFGLLVAGLTDVKKTKEKHQWSGQLLKALMEDGFNGTALYAATRNGITEMVIATLSRLSDPAIAQSVLQVAVANRQPLVVKVLRMKMQSKPELWDQLIKGLDNNRNTILHLAARAPASDKPWQIAGSSALQMMWDLKWYQYVKSLLQSSPAYLLALDKNKKTASELFADEHKDLIEKSSEWLKSTSESCSVVAALVVGVSFATASTVPGGNNDKGKPALEGEPAFNAFAIASLVGFYSSVTALVLFLSMKTSRNQAKDFRRDLPLKLLLGLSFLFVSIVAMLVSFSTGHFFLLHNEYKTAQLLPIYGASSLPVIFVVAQFQLFFDLLTTILTEVPGRPTDKFANL